MADAHVSEHRVEHRVEHLCRWAMITILPILLFSTSLWANPPKNLDKAPTKTPEKTPVLDANTKTEEKSGTIFRKIPAGVVDIVCIQKGECSDKKTTNHLNIASYWLMEHETTVGEYLSCVRAGACGRSDDWIGCNIGEMARTDRIERVLRIDEKQALRQPMNCVSWQQAQDFCRWLGGSLPTAAQWQLAAVGPKAEQKYPWGQESASCERAILREGDEGAGGEGCRRQGTWPVCSKPSGNTPDGICDLLGNVWEWTSSSWLSGHEVRGGSFYSAFDAVAGNKRAQMDDTYHYADIGFRCALP